VVEAQPDEIIRLSVEPGVFLANQSYNSWKIRILHWCIGDLGGAAAAAQHWASNAPYLRQRRGVAKGSLLGSQI
jgi:hypothetical protein